MGLTRAEERKARADRIAATKKNSRKKKLQAKYAPPKETPEFKATRSQQAKDASKKIFEKWLESPAVKKFLEENPNQRHYGLTWWLKGYLDDLAKEMNAKPE